MTNIANCTYEEMEIFYTRIEALHQNARTLAGQHRFSQQTIQDIDYNCKCSFNEKQLLKYRPKLYAHR